MWVPPLRTPCRRKFPKFLAGPPFWGRRQAGRATPPERARLYPSKLAWEPRAVRVVWVRKEGKREEEKRERIMCGETVSARGYGRGSENSTKSEVKNKATDECREGRDEVVLIRQHGFLAHLHLCLCPHPLPRLRIRRASTRTHIRQTHIYTPNMSYPQWTIITTFHPH